ncbi:MAG TPA: DUF4276 family protein [Thermoanaerobaculia bacterium]|nr:DUF4276 family protein [Thermoanaerobaculia bacterium]
MAREVLLGAALEHGGAGGQSLVRVKLYIEGGGEGKPLDELFRRAWRRFFEKAGLGGRMPRVVRGGSRLATFDAFKTAVANRRSEDPPMLLPMLLVDSEAAVEAGHSVWQHLRRRDGWDRPPEAGEDQAFLMVQVMETWFVADRATLRSFFGESFKESHLPPWPDLEAVPKVTVLAALDRASAGCGARRYKKGPVSFKLLEQLNPALVESACPGARALLAALRKH